MISLNERLDQAFKKALKGQQQTELATLRMLKTAIRHKEVELKHPLSEAEILATINSQAKQRRDAIAEYTKAGRPDWPVKKRRNSVSSSLFCLRNFPLKNWRRRSSASSPRWGPPAPGPGQSDENRHG
jgi:hypothetical protein